MADPDIGWSDSPARQNAHANMAAASGVPPQAAVTAMQRGAPLGIPPSVGMTQPDYVNQVADQTGWSDAVNNHPPVAAFVAKSPAHAAAASGSMPELATVSQKAQQYFSEGGPLQDYAAAIKGYVGGLVNSPLLNGGKYDPSKQGLFDLPQFVLSALGGAGIPFAPLTAGAARAYGQLPLYSSPLSPGGSVKLEGAAKSQAAQEAIGTAFLGLSPAEGIRGPMEQPAPGETPRGTGPGPTAPDAVGRQPFHNGTNWNTNAEGFLADEQGRPVGFQSPRDAASWRMQHGGDQVFEPDLHGEGVGLRDVEARPGDPYWETRRAREPTPGSDPQTDEVLAEHADRNADVAAQAEEAVAKTPLHSQAPEIMQEFLDGTEAGNKDVQIDPFVLKQLYEEGHTPFQGRMDDIEEAMFRGTSVTVPYSEYLAEVSGKPFAEQVRAGTSFTEGGISQNEATEIKGKHADVSPGDTAAPLTPGAGFSIKDLPVYTPDQSEIIDRLVAEKKIEAENVKQNPIPRGQIPHEVQFGKDHATNKEIRQKVKEAQANSTVQTISLDKIRSPQKSITGSVAEGAEPKAEDSVFNSDEDKTHGTLEKYRGEYYVRDGNHRIVKLLSEGKTEGKFSVIDLDKHLDTGWKETPERPAYVPPKDVPAEFHEPLRNIAAAVEGHIDQIFKDQSLGKVFDSPKAVGMTAAQFERYSNALENAKFDLREKVLNKLYNQIKRERTPDWKAAVELAKEEAVARLNEHPNIVAYRNLKDPLFRLNSQLVQERYSNLAKEVPKNLQKVGGTDPDDMAELLGYPSGGELVKEMVLLQRAMDAIGAKSLDGFIKQSANAMAQMRARELAGFDGSPEGIQKEVEQTASGPEMEDFLVAELKALKALTPNEPLNVEQIKSKAEDIFSNMPTKSASSIKLAERAVWKTGNAAQFALEKGNWVAAFKAKQQQLLNHYILRMTHEFNQERKVFDRKARDFASSRSKPSIPQEMMNQIHSFLQQYGYKVPQTQLRYDYNAWAEGERALGKAVLPYSAPAPIDISKMPVHDFRDVADRLANMIFLGKDEGMIKVLGDNLEMALLVHEAETAAQPVKKKPVLADATITEGRVTPALVNSWMYSPQVMFDILDNRNPNGVFNRVLMQGARIAAATEHDIIGPEDKAVADILKDMGVENWERMHRYVPKGHGLMRPDRPGLETNLTYKDLVGIMLHMGHKEGRWHLEEGGWGWQRSAYEALVMQEATSKDWDLVDRIHKSLDGMWPRIAENEKQLSGLAPEKVKATPIILHRDMGVDEKGNRKVNVEVHDGGYFPLKRDDRISSALKGGVRTDPGGLWAHFLQEGATPKGHTIRRVAASYVPSLDWMNVIQSHIPNVAKRIAYGKWALDSLKFLSQPEIVKLVEDVHGPHGMAVLRGWLQRQLGYRSMDPRAAAGLDSMLRELRLRVYAVETGFKISVMLEHATSIAQTAGQAGLGTTARGYMRWLANPLEAHKFAVESSDYMRIRAGQVDREMRDIIDDIHNNRSTLLPPLPGLGRIHLPVIDPATVKFREFAQGLFAWVNHHFAAVPAFTGAYHDALAGKAVPSGRLKPVPPMTPEEAIAYGEKVVSKSHGSGMELDMGTFQSGGSNELLKTFNMFNVFRGIYGSLLREGMYHAFHGQDTEEALAGWKQLLIVAFGVGVTADIAIDRMPKDAKNYVTWILGSAINGMSHMVPMGANAYETAGEIIKGKPPEFEVSPVEGTITSAGKSLADLSKAIQKKKVADSRAVENAAILIGMLLHLPGAGQAGETFQSIHDMLHPGKAGRVTRPVPALLFGPSHERERKE